LTRAEAEDFLFHEAALLDAWRLDEWLALLTDDARYLVPSNDAPDADPASALFLIADDIARIRGRVARLKDPMAHVEFPHSRTRRLITNVRIVTPGSDPFKTGDRPRLSPDDNRGRSPVLDSGVTVEANFTVHRFRRGEQVSQYVGRYRYRLRMVDGQPRIARREAILDSHELGSLGAVSFIL
jgi:p-cumate 2,3-dioxygenase subunit beta